MAESFTQIQLPQQKSFSSIPLPAVLSPANPTTLHDLTQSVKAQLPFLKSLLHESGALLFRGCPINSASDFNDFVEAFGFDELPYIGGAAIRTRIVGRVFTANESPPDQEIQFHHEMARLPEFPTKLFFFCEEEPGSGGETPIVLSHVVYDKMKEKHPGFVQKIEDHGFTYSRVFGEEDDLLSATGRGWKSTFGTEDKTVAEKRAGELGMKLEWSAAGVKSIIGPKAAIKYDESRHRKIWFNSMLGAFTLGNGESCHSDIINDCQRIQHDQSVAIPWKKGDVLLIDNLAVLHARRPSTGPRRVLASLCK